MGKQAGSQTVTTQPDQFTDQMRRAVWGAAQGAAGAPVPGLDPLTQQAIGGYQRAATAGNLGLSALSGDQNAIHTFYDPYQQNVLNAAMSNWQQLAAQTTNALNDQATRAGAFGGSRQGVAQGVALAQMNQDKANQLAGLQYQGYNDAMARAGQLADAGLGATGQLAQLGDYSRGISLSQDPAMHRFLTYQSALAGMPGGSSVTQPVNRNAGAGLLGGAATGAGIASALNLAGKGSPWGWITTGLGGLLGAF